MGRGSGRASVGEIRWCERSEVGRRTELNDVHHSKEPRSHEKIVWRGSSVVLRRVQEPIVRESDEKTTLAAMVVSASSSLAVGSRTFARFLLLSLRLFLRRSRLPELLLLSVDCSELQQFDNALLRLDESGAMAARRKASDRRRTRKYGRAKVDLGARAGFGGRKRGALAGQSRLVRVDALLRRGPRCPPYRNLSTGNHR